MSTCQRIPNYISAHAYRRAQNNTINLKIKRFNADAEWAEFVWRNRFDEKYRRPDYDIIIGPIADLGLKREFIRMRTEGLSFADVASRIHYDKHNSLQVSFCTPYSLTILNKV